jgi:DNA-binding response OmpR family regulator
VGAGAEVATSMSVEDMQQRVQDGSFDVIVMNGRMPGGWSTEAIYEWIAKNRPGLEKRLLLTFSTETDQQTRNFIHEHGVPSLAKPFELADLISRVRELSHGNTEEKASIAGAGG